MAPPHNTTTPPGFHSAAEPPSVSAAQTCVDEARVQEHAVSVGPQEPPYRLNCPLEPAPSSGSPLFQTAWQKDCRQLPAQNGKPYLEFASVSLEDQGNYTCVPQGNSTASYTLRLTVEGTYRCTVPPLGVSADRRTPARRCLASPPAPPGLILAMKASVVCSQRR